MGPIDLQLDQLRTRCGQVLTQDLQATGLLVRIPEVALPAGWNKPATQVLFIAPHGYPFAKPDCFWADADLRLATGAVPKATQLNNIPGLQEQNLWFSWHVDPWNPNRDNLVTWFVLIRQRLADAQ